MGRTIRAILFTAEADYAPELRKVITAFEPVRIVADLDEASLLPQAVSQFPCELLIADLDPNPAVVLECLKQLRQAAPHLPIFAVSAQTEGDIVLRAMRAGVKEFLIKPVDPAELQTALEQLSDLPAAAKEPGKLISFMGAAGGVGCTTLATNLAVELAELTGKDGKVAVVDLDFRFGHVATLLDVTGQHTVADLCSTPEQLDPEMVMKALVRHESGVHVLRRPHTFAQAEMTTAAHCAAVLTSLQEMFAYVIVDGPTRHDPGGRIVLDSADYNFLVMQLLVTHVRNADRMAQELAAQGFNPERLTFLCNRVGRESAYLEVQQVEAILNRKIHGTIADDWKAVSSSINIGQPLKTEFARSKVRQDIRHLAMKIHCPQQLAAEETGGRGLLSKLFRKGTENPEPSAATPPVVGVQ